MSAPIIPSIGTCRAWRQLQKRFRTGIRGYSVTYRSCYLTNRRLGPVRTHHNLTTQRITFEDSGKTGHAVTYFQGAHFGQGPHEGKLLCAYGRYIDELVLQDVTDGDYEGVPGASGIWRIKKRKVAFTQRIGDEKIMSEH